MHVDLALNTFEADTAQLVRAGVDAEAAGVHGLWVPDHFSGAVVGRRWSRDAFACLGALALATERVRLGPLVANVRNRHAAQLASAANTVASLAPGRTVLGMGSGAAPGSRFAVEHDAVGTELGDAEYRRRLLVEHIHAVRAFHGRRAGDPPPERTEPAGDDRLAVTDGAACPPIVVGASARATVDVATTHADGVNLRANEQTASLVEAARSAAGSDFEISVLVGPEVDRGLLDRYRDLGVDRVVVGVEVVDDGTAIPELLDVLGNWVRTL